MTKGSASGQMSKVTERPVAFTRQMGNIRVWSIIATKKGLDP